MRVWTWTKEDTWSWPAVVQAELRLFFLFGVWGFSEGQEEGNHHHHPKEARNADSLNQSLKVRSAQLLHQNSLEKKWLLKLQDSGLYNIAPEFQFLGVGGSHQESAF